MSQQQKPGKARGYGRASTEEQEDTLIDQEQRILAAYQQTFAPQGYGWGGQYTDKGVSGAIPLVERPQGYRLCLELDPGDLVIVTHLDRAFRKVLDLCRMLETWEARHVRLVMLDMNIDTGTPMGMAMIQQMAVFAQLERGLASQRTRDVIASRRQRGLPVGGGHPPYGFKRVGPRGARRLVPHPEQRQLGKLIVDWLNSGWSVDQVYEHLARNNINNPNTKQPIARACVWRYYCWEQQLQEMEQQEGS